MSEVGSADEALGRAEELLERLKATREELERLAAAGGRRGRRRGADGARRAREGGRGRAREGSRPRRCSAALTSSVLSSRGISASSRSRPSWGVSRRRCGIRSKPDGKRVRPVIALAVGEAAGAAAEHVLPAAAAVELVHTFSLVHDDLPALDDDDERRGRPSAHIAFGEATALLAGDALLAEAFRLALSYPTPMVGRELAQATLGMIGGQHRDVTGDTADLAALHRLKTGALFSASVGVALWVAEVPEGEQPAWRAFGDELGLLFQIVDDLLDGDGYVEAARRRGGAPARRRCRHPRAGTARRDSRGHERARRDRRVARSPHHVGAPAAGRPRGVRRHGRAGADSRVGGRRRGAAATSS